MPVDTADRTPARPPLHRRVATAMRDTGRRNIYFAAVAIPGHLTMAASKGVILLFSFSAFMTANMLFTLGMALIKSLVIIAHLRATRRGADTAIARAYRSTGVIVLVGSVLYVVSCLPLVLGGDISDRYDRGVAIAIAAIAFTELGFAVHGLVASLRHRDVLMEAVKLSNLAAALILLVLAQTALLSISLPADQDPSGYNGVCGLVFGSVAALIGVVMIVRSRSRLIRRGGGAEDDAACCGTAGAVVGCVRCVGSRSRSGSRSAAAGPAPA